MWKVASALGPGAAVTAAEHSLPKADKFIYYARFIALGASVAFLILGALRIALAVIGDKLSIAGIVFGSIIMILGALIATIEYPFVPLAKHLNIFTNYMFRAILYVVCIIPTFFSVITFVAGLILLGAAACYGYGHFKNAKGTEVVEQPPQDIEAQQQQQQQQQDTKTSRFSLKGKSAKPAPEISEEPAPSKSKKSSKNSKKSKFSLSSLGAAYGQDDE